MQPLDLTVNRIAKSFLQRQFREWYATEVLDENAAGSQVTCAPVRFVDIMNEVYRSSLADAAIQTFGRKSSSYG